MTANFSKILKIGSSIVGISTTGTFGAYKLSTKTIKDNAIDLLPEKETNEEIWNKAKQNWESKKNEKKFFNSLEDNTWTGFRNKCISFYKETYSTWFKDKKEDLLNEIKDICSLGIKEVIKKEKLITIDDSTKKSKQNKKIFQDKFIGPPRNILVHEKELSSIIFGGNENWEKLESWCEASYNDKYVGKNNKWNLIETYCTNS